MVTIQLRTKDGKSIVHKSKVDTWFNGVVEKSTFMKANKNVVLFMNFRADVKLGT